MAAIIITDNTHSITLKPGEQFTLPPNSTVIGYSGTLSSDCADLPDTSNLNCYRIAFAVDEDKTPSPMLEFQEVEIESIKALGVTYSLNLKDPAGGGDIGLTSGSEPALAQRIASVLPQGFMINIGGTATNVGNRWEHTMTFQAIDTIASTIELKIIGTSYGDGLWVRPLQIDC